MSHACILNEVFSNLVYMLDESKTAKDTQYLEPVLNSYVNLVQTGVYICVTDTAGKLIT